MNRWAIELSFAAMMIAAMVGMMTCGRVGLAGEPVRDWSAAIESLEDDNPRVRATAIKRLIDHAATADEATWHAIIHGIGTVGLDSQLESQLIARRLLDDLRRDRLDRHLDRLMDWQSESSWLTDRRDDSDWVAVPIVSAWSLFAARAGSGRETTQVFCDLIRSMDHEVLTTDGDLKEIPVLIRSPESLAWHLGCLAPSSPRCHLPTGREVAERLGRVAAGVSRSHSPQSRVLGRLIDDLLRRNAYGWSIEQRLGLAVVYQRRSVAIELISQIRAANPASPADTVTAMLAGDRIGWSPVQSMVLRSLRDPRVLSVTAGHAVWIGRGGRPTANHAAPAINPPGAWPGKVVRTRVQDIAVMLWLQWHDLDPRDFAMTAMSADPVWGIDRYSVGFTSATDREAALAFIAAEASSRESGEPDHPPVQQFVHPMSSDHAEPVGASSHEIRSR